MTAETKTVPGTKSPTEHYPDKHASQIQLAVSALAEMEGKLDELSSQVVDMKRRLLIFAETQADQAKAEIIEDANREAQAALESVRQSAQSEADEIVSRGSTETEALRKRISGKISSAAEIVVRAVQSA
jgi:vacuolar-type H+-ATPase subunit H